MQKNTPVGIFLAAAAALSTNAIFPGNSIAGDNHADMGGLKEWTTDQDANEDGKLDEAISPCFSPAIELSGIIALVARAVAAARNIPMGVLLGM